MFAICSRREAISTLPALFAILALLLTLAMPRGAHAHRVNIFAWTEGDQVVAECGFNGGNKVKQGQVVVYDAATGAKMLEGLTDDQGTYRFSVPAGGKAHGLRIVVKAGEGHQNEWTMDAAELAAAQPSAPASAAAANNAEVPASAQPAAPAAQKISSTSHTAPTATPGANGATASPPNAVGVSSGELQNIVNTALEAKLGPIRRELAEMRVSRPGFSEIFGGIGWLVGLAGIALYFKGRRG